MKIRQAAWVGLVWAIAQPSWAQTVSPPTDAGTPSDAAVPQRCVGGRTEVDREGHCCLPGQTWAGGHCAGAPTSCAPGETHTANGQGCTTRACEPGETRVSNHCCAPAQTWDDDEHRCVGTVARCPEGQVLQGGGCLPSSGLRAVAADGARVSIGGAVFRRGSAVVVLGPFAIDRTEVTVGAYARCVAAGVCPEAPAMFGVEPRSDAPVVNVSWDMARRYCGFDGGRLPTEAEWELAARGTDGRRYPWGERLPDCSLARFNGCGSAALRTDAHPTGASPLGLVDMAGNVAEWVADWSGPLVTEGLLRDPTGPTRGTLRVVRGGSFVSSPAALEAGARGASLPDEGRFDTGFRCVRGR